ncbi:hypothetical protein ACM39_17595 [Chryseobacterium sp. FH2]|uniref:hypothetical protein n=1 Tax=Chryseobacterium sp. FH2 TaxID=1674291 RepID=UPI00065AF3C6|nr:hypothetical protein [Chryseobacterium sp. FH2]KMQ62923.1 hypothetical protein ACM39_17595 [Chryseobacterium sp. FH2]
MKKVLLGAFLVAGTTLAFAKESTPVQNFSNNKEIISLKSTTVRVNSLEEAEKLFGICHSTTITPVNVITSFDDGLGHTVYMIEHYWDVQTIWYGC